MSIALIARLLAIVLLTLGTACVPTARPSIAPDPAATTAKGILASAGTIGQFSGTSLVARGDQVILLESYGLADRERQLPNAVETQYDIGSVGKLFTAAAVLQLVQDGHVTLAAPLSTYLPSYPPAVADQVTVEQLLLHTSGLGDYITKPAYFAGAKDELHALEDYLPLLEQDPLRFTGMGGSTAMRVCTSRSDHRASVRTRLLDVPP